MKLYYMPGACSMAAHIVLNEVGAPTEFARVDRQTRKTPDGEDYLAINPNGYVPALRLDDGSVLLENVAILAYVGDLKPDAGWAPQGGRERYTLLQWLSYVNSELHGGYKPLFGDIEEAKGPATEKLLKRYATVDEALGTSPYLMGENPTVADAYLFVVTTWSDRLKIDLGRYANLAAFMERMRQRPAVHKTLQEEGLTG